MSDELVAKTRALLKAATPGPWGVFFDYYVARPEPHLLFSVGAEYQADAVLVAAAPMLLAALADRVEFQQKRIAELASELVELRSADLEATEDWTTQALAQQKRIAELERERDDYKFLEQKNYDCETKLIADLRARIAELERAREEADGARLNAMIRAAEDQDENSAQRAALQKRIAELEGALKPFRDSLAQYGPEDCCAPREAYEAAAAALTSTPERTEGGG